MAGEPTRGAGRAAASLRDCLESLAGAGLLVAVAAAAAELLAGPGTRIGWWPFPRGFAILRWGAYGGLAGAAMAVAAAAASRPGSSRRVLPAATIALVVGLAAAGVPWGCLQYAKTVPPIHDITTDTENPPSFVALRPLRLSTPNGAEYGGPEVAAKQRAAYPDLRPTELGVPPREAFDRALAAARSMGWAIASADPADGRIEATATTFWFGFKDDVVVRVVPSGTGSRVDVRSVSRVGKSDLGTNARRIREYLKTLSGNR